MKPLRSAFEV